MIGKLATGMARRGILKGALGLGAAVGLGGKVGNAATLPPQALSAGVSSHGGWVIPTHEEEPEWLKAMGRETSDLDEAEMLRPRVDTLDIDLAVMRGPSPAWKLNVQRARDKARRDASRKMWDRLREARDKWVRSIIR